VIFASIASLASLVLVAEPSIARSLDPHDCPSDKRRVEFRGVVFCWPTHETAPWFGFPSPDRLFGGQDWIGTQAVPRRRADSELGDRVGAYFTIVPFDHVELQYSARRLSAAAEIRAALEKQAGDPEPVVDLFLGKWFGTRTFRFREVEPNLFAAVLALEQGSIELTYEFWALVNSDGPLDYMFSCDTSGKVRMCSGHFPLASSIATVTVNYAGNSDLSHHIFQAMRAQIRSYVLHPKLDDL
jgi:hypothetical protein